MSMISWASDVFGVAAEQTAAFCTGALAGLIVSQLLIWVELRYLGAPPTRHMRTQWLTLAILATVLTFTVLLLLLTHRWEI